MSILDDSIVAKEKCLKQFSHRRSMTKKSQHQVLDKVPVIRHQRHFHVFKYSINKSDGTHACLVYYFLYALSFLHSRILTVSAVITNKVKGSYLL